MPVTLQDYERAESFLPGNLAKRAYGLELKPNWTGKGNEFWYSSRCRKGMTYYRVQPEAGIQEPAFDHNRLAAALSQLQHLAEPNLNAQELELSDLAWPEHGLLDFTFREKRWQCELSSYSCRELNSAKESLPSCERLSPDGRYSIFTDVHNLFLRRMDTGEVIPLTTDGQAYYDYGGYPESNLVAVTMREHRHNTPPNALWSPDSRQVLTQRLDQRNVGVSYLLQHCPQDSIRPVLHEYRFPLPNDDHLPTYELVIINIDSQEVIMAGPGPLEFDVLEPISNKQVWWSKDSRTIYLAHTGRYHKTIRLFEIDAQDGKSKLLLEESGDTYVELSPFVFGNPNVALIHDDRQFLWYSERNGWGNLYRYDRMSRQLLNPLLEKPFVVHRIEYVDEEDGWVYLSGGGYEMDLDPYFAHLYRVKWDGSSLQRLTPEDAYHEVSFSPEGSYFIDTYSRVDLPPVSVLRKCNGDLVLTLLEADISELEKVGWVSPEPFRVKGRDGETNIYGLIFRPSQFNENYSYPVIDSIYPGPQRIRTPKRFQFDPAQALAELGFIVVTIDGMGTPLRSKAFHDVSYANFDEAGGLEDHVAAIRQLAEQYPNFDVGRVGIYGHSAGGFAAIKAMLLFPEFFKVAVSSAGCHNLRGNIAGWAEKYGGPLSEEDLMAQSNLSHAANLKGKLLLVTGDMDDNVPPALTLQMVEALIQADKDFDLLIVPNANHKVNVHPYFIRRFWNYFVKHLLGVEPPGGYRIGAESK